MADSIKEALHNTIHRHPTKSVAAIAEEIGVSENYLYRAALPDQEEGGSDSGCRFPLKKLIPLIRATGDFQALDYIEQALGRVAVPVSLPDCAADSLPLVLAKSVEQFSKLLNEYADMIADFRVTKDEAERFEGKAFSAMRQIAVFSLVVNQAAKKTR